eukprot:6211744-Pleurochrysis_carterae.AAC.1
MSESANECERERERSSAHALRRARRTSAGRAASPYAGGGSGGRRPTRWARPARKTGGGAPTSEGSNYAALWP